MHIAITGGLGRLGQYVVRAVAAHTPRVLDIGTPADPGENYHHADLRDLPALAAALQGIEVVVHLGAIDRSFATDDAATMQVNAMGTWNLFEASRRAGVRRVVHCSSSSATGLDASNPGMPPRYLPIDEAHPTHPTDAYGLSKLCGERIAEAFSRQGMQVLVIRPCFVAFPEMADFMAGRPRPGRPRRADALSARLCRSGGLRAGVRRRGDGRLRRFRGIFPCRRGRLRHRADGPAHAGALRRDDPAARRGAVRAVPARLPGRPRSGARPAGLGADDAAGSVP